MKKGNHITIIISIIALIIFSILLFFSYGYINSIVALNAGLVNQTLSFEGEYNLTTYGNTSVNVNLFDVDMYGMDENKVVAITNTNITIELTNNYSSGGTTCSFNYIWVWDEDSDNYTISKGATKESTVSGPFEETQIPNYDDSNILGSGKISTTSTTIKKIYFENKIYNLENIDQSVHYGKKYSGSIRLSNIHCQQFQMTAIEYSFENNSCALKDNVTNNYSFDNSCTNPNNYAYVENSEKCEANTLYRIIETNVQTGNTTLVKASDIQNNTWDYWVNNNFSGVNKITLTDDYYLTVGEGTTENPYYIYKNIALLSSLRINTDQTFKTDYTDGEVLNTTGLIVTALYSNNTSRVLSSTEYTVGSQQKSDNKYTYKITYSEGDITKSDYVFIDIGNYFYYTGGSQSYTIPNSGYYDLEVWGAEGGSSSNESGGLGGYSKGTMYFEANTVLYIFVGGKGGSTASATGGAGGYNGGGTGGRGLTSGTYNGGGGGGGATHISTTSSTLSLMGLLKTNVLIVAGGGGGATYYNGIKVPGGNAGGYVGNAGSLYSGSTGNTIGGNQMDGYLFGKGQSGRNADNNYANGEVGNGGGGGGWYGGRSSQTGDNGTSGGGGGSSYIGTTNLYNKVMYCYSCEESDEISTKTISTTNVSETPQSGYAKYNNGAARINYSGDSIIIEEPPAGDFYYTNNYQTYTVNDTGYYLLEVWGAEGGDSISGKGGYGGYSKGAIYLSSGTTLYVVVGGKGVNASGIVGGAGGYNGGGDGGNTEGESESHQPAGGGGGATHIAKSLSGTGILSMYTILSRSNVLIVAGGGGGAAYYTGNGYNGGYGGGYQATAGAVEASFGDNNSGGTQSSGHLFGKGQNGRNGKSKYTFGESGAGGAGGGYYGGKAATDDDNGIAGGGGGSGYIGKLVSNTRSMYCYNCQESTTDSTKTISTTNVSSTATSNYAKIGNGFARITYLGSSLE